MTDRFNAIFLGIAGIWVGGLLALFQLDLPWTLNLLVAAPLSFTLAAFVVLQDEPRRAAIAGFLDAPGYGSWYAAIVTPVAGWPRDWRCYDWALRIAVLYPIFSMVLIWAVTGQAGRICTVEFLPAHDSWMTSVATICTLALALMAPLSKKIERQLARSTP